MNPLQMKNMILQVTILSFKTDLEIVGIFVYSIIFRIFPIPRNKIPKSFCKV